MPSIWGLPSAELVETACIAHGDDCCEYHLRWYHQPRWMPIAGGALFGVVGAATASVFGLATISPYLALPVIGGLMGRVYELSRVNRANLEHGETPILDDTFCTHSAVSDDGVAYTYESGERFCTDGRAVIDPAVGYLDGTWYYEAPRGAPQEGGHFATSTDGVTFVEGTAIPSDRNHRWTGNFVPVDGNLRFYGAEVLFPSGNFLWWSESADGGGSWSDYTRIDVPAGKDPGIVRRDDGSFILLVPTSGP